MILTTNDPAIAFIFPVSFLNHKHLTERLNKKLNTNLL